MAFPNRDISDYFGKRVAEGGAGAGVGAAPAAEPLDLPGATAWIYRGFLSGHEQVELTRELRGLPHWAYRDIVVAGKPCKQHRETCTLSDDPALAYHYSGVGDEVSPPMTPAVAATRDRIAAAVGFAPNFCLLNRYNTGKEVVGWHADKTADLEHPHYIASLSLGATRRFEFRRRNDRVTVLKLELHSGDLVVMAKNVQKLYHHRIAPQAKIVEPRYNLTYREAKGRIQKD